MINLKLVQANNTLLLGKWSRFMFMCRVLSLLLTAIIISTSVLTGCSGGNTQITGAWHLIEVQTWDNYQTITAPYHISWIGAEGDIDSTITVDSPYNAISSINAKWTIPPEILVSGGEYQMECSVTAVTQNMGPLVEEGGEEFIEVLVVEKVLTFLEGDITAGLDEYNVLPDGATRSRISIIPENNYPRIRWNDIDGTVKSGKFTFKAPEYGFANSRHTNKMTLTVKYQHNMAILAWRYIYEWTDKATIPTRMETTTITP